MSSAVAAGGILVLAMLAPFEMASPLVRLPGQSLTNLEAALVLVGAAWAAAIAWSGKWPRPAPLLGGWMLFVAAMAIAAATAGAQRANALHMVGRLAAAGVVYWLAVEGITTSRRLRAAVAACVISGFVVAMLAILEYLQVAPVLRVLRLFRPAVTAVGAQVRAGGSLQYPTIASMYLEVVFAFGLGLMMAALDSGRRRRTAIAFAALVVIGEAIALTFTRAGLVTMTVSLLCAAAWRWRQRGIDRGCATVGALGCSIAVLFLASRPAESLWLRMTSDGQNGWYRARIEAPAAVALRADAVQYVPLRVTNVGRIVWDSSSTPPVLVSYHWLDASGDRVVAWEGDRTSFSQAVPPGSDVAVVPLVRAPREPGRYQIEWDLVEEGRLWFSTEQDAPDPVLTSVAVTGRGTGVPLTTRPRPIRAVRPGRMVLWKTALHMIAAHPWLGVGPDNFRLLYGSYAGLSGADPRTHANNMYLEVLVGGGAAAFAVFAAFCWRAVALFARGRGMTGPGVESSTGFGMRATVALGTEPRAAVNPLWTGVAAAGLAIALHGLVDSFLSFAPTYILFALTLGFAAALARGVETPADAHRV